MNENWVAFLGVWIIVESIQFFRNVPFRSRLRAAAWWATILVSLMELGQTSTAINSGGFIVAAIGFNGLAAILFYWFRLFIAKTWNRFVKGNHASSLKEFAVKKIQLLNDADLIKSNPLSPSSSPAADHNMPNEHIWAAALAELESVARRPGLWAKALANAAGNEEAAKADYLRVRAHELQAEEEAERQRRRDEEEAERQRRRDEAQRQHALLKYAQMSTGNLNDAEIAIACKAKLETHGFQVERLTPNKWSIANKSGISYVYSVEELKKKTLSLMEPTETRRTYSRSKGEA